MEGSRMANVFDEAVAHAEKYRAPSGLYGLYTDGKEGSETQNGALFSLETMLLLENIFKSLDHTTKISRSEIFFDLADKF
jgi:hypothetical protein